MSLEIDVRGLSCPIPVVKTQKAMEKSPQETIVVLLETEVSKENVTRLAQSNGYDVTVEQSGDEYRMVLQPGAK